MMMMRMHNISGFCLKRFYSNWKLDQYFNYTTSYHHYNNRKAKQHNSIVAANQTYVHLPTIYTYIYIYWTNERTLSPLWWFCLILLLYLYLLVRLLYLSTSIISTYILNANYTFILHHQTPFSPYPPPHPHGGAAAAAALLARMPTFIP